MATSVIAVKLPQSFRKRLADVRQQQEDLQQGVAQLAVMYVKFCREYYEVSEQAEGMDAPHKTAALAALEADFTHVDASVRSKWKTIGKNAKTLLAAEVVKALPPVRDSLYALAKATPTKVARLVKAGQVTPDTPIATVRSLVATKVKGRKALKKKSSQASATVTLGFTTYTDAAKALATLLQSDIQLQVSARPAFQSAVKAHLGPDAYQAVARYFS